MPEGYVFKSEEDINRVMRAVRVLEGLEREFRIGQSLFVPAGASIVVARVSGPRVGSGTSPTEPTPDLETADETGYYPGRFKIWDPSGKVYYEEPATDGTSDPKCYVSGLNDEDLETDTYYGGYLSGSINGMPVVKAIGPMGTGGGPSSGPCSHVVGWPITACVEAELISRSGTCLDIPSPQSLVLKWDSSRWKSGDDVESDPEDDFVYDAGAGDGGLGPIEFGIANGVVFAKIDGSYGVNVGCDEDGRYLFEFGGTPLCVGVGTGPTADGCPNNSFVVAFGCVCCPDKDWTGSGWYCTAEDDCVLIETQPCVGEHTITSGPHATEAECIGICGGTPESSCPCIAGDTLHVAISNVSGCAGAAGVAVTLARGAPLPGPLPNPAFSLSSAPGGGGCGNVTDCSYNCETRQFSIVFGADNTNLIPVVLALDSCSPFQASGDVALTFSSDETCCTGTIHVVVTE